jgi:hypothetical protein
MLARIKASELWGPRSRESGNALSGLRCPECGRDAWAYKDSPGLIICNHKNSCGARVRTLDLFPDLRQNFEREFAPTKEDPNRPAREYLYSRGISAKTLDGVKFEYRRNIRKSGSGGVLFFVGTGADGREVWNGRLFSPPPGVDKAHNEGPTRGMLWRHPKVVYDPGRPTFLTEGIIEALSMQEMGLQAVTPLTSGADPDLCEAAIAEFGIAQNLVVAFNPDAAGGDGLKKWKRKYPAAKAIAPVSGDWNDLLQNLGPQKAREAFDAGLSEMTCRADLLLAEKAQSYADIWFAFYGYPPGLFSFEKKYYWGAFGKRDLEVRNVSDFVCETDHYQLDSSNPDNHVYRYCLKIYPAAGQPTYCALSGKDLSTPASIRSALLEGARAMWKGNDAPSLALASRIVDSGAPVVRQVQVLGHDRQSGALIFSHFLVDREGKLHVPDSRGFYRLSRREVLRPPAVQTARDGSINPKKGEKMKRIYDLISAAWPQNGPLALAFTMASWFVYVVKPELGFFPFLSLHGDTQTGKSQLVRLLNATQCVDGEGLPMTKLNTGKGEIRDLAKKSGLMIPLLEGNKEERMRFDLDSLLTLFNAGNPLQVRAVKSNDLQTKVTEFLGTLIFVQNKEPFRTKAQKERVVSSKPFRSDDITAETSLAFRELLKIPLREMAQCYVEIMQNRKWIEENWFAEYLKARNEILERTQDNRIAETHGLVLGFHRLAEKFFGAKNELSAFFYWLAERKHRQCAHREATMADQFFDALDSINPEVAAKFVDVEGGRLFVNLAEALKTLDGNGFKFFGQALYEPLREHPAYLLSNHVHRAKWAFDAMGLGGGRTSLKKTWAFDTAKLGMYLGEALVSEK